MILYGRTNHKPAIKSKYMTNKLKAGYPCNIKILVYVFFSPSSYSLCKNNFA